MYYWYKLFSYLFYPLAPLYLILRKIRKKEHPDRYKEKLALIKQQRGQGFLIWFHAASVGEALSILPLIENLEQEEKIKKILITTITLSSSEVLEKRIGGNKKIVHQFFPLDIPKFVNKFLNHWTPNLCILVDSEIWPNLILSIKKKNIPLLLVNGRITKKTFSKWKLVSLFAKKIFGKFDLCIVANNETEKRLKILGVGNIKNYGNLKFASTKIKYNINLSSDLLNKIKDRKIWSAASTHPSEEMFCAKTHLKLKKKYENLLTIIIPRHLDRIKMINKELSSLNLKIDLYSKLDQVDKTTDILLVDAYGENFKFFNLSKSVFLGGSLIKHGGQNPIEPSRFGCKIFHGPNIDNFTEIYNYLESLGISRPIVDHEELVKSLTKEFELDKTSNQIVEKIENYGQNVLNNVIKDLKKYIST